MNIKEYIISFPFEHYILNFNFFIISVSFIIFIFAKRITGFLDTTDLEKKRLSEEDEKQILKKVHFLRIINIFIFVVYFISLGVELDFLNSFIKVLFIILSIYISNAWCVKRVLIYYGDEVEISGEKYFKKGYKASFFSFLIQSIFIGISFFLIIETLGIDNYLQIGGIIAGIIAFFGFTATVWAPDVIAGIIILHNDRIQIGNVVYIKELDVYGWIKRISLSEIKLIDLTYSHPILFRPSQFRTYTIENLSSGIIGKKSIFTRIIDIEIGYEYTQDSIEKLCNDAYHAMLKNITENQRKYFPTEEKTKLEIVSFENDAVKYRFLYHINSPFYLVKTEQLLNRYLKQSQEKYKIHFSTPKLIDIQKNS